MIYILCIIFPPLAVYIRTRKIGLAFLNSFYTVFLFVPAIIHAFIIVSRNKHIKFSDRIKSEKFELVNELDKVVKHIKNQIEFNTIINDVIGEKYKPHYYDYDLFKDEIEDILKSWDQDNKISKSWTEKLKDSNALYTSVLKDESYFKSTYKFAEVVIKKIIEEYKPKKYKENFTNEELLIDLNELIKDSKKFFDSSGYLRKFLPFPETLKKNKNLILFLTTNIFNKTTEDLKDLYKDIYTNGDLLAADEIYKIPTITKKIEEYIKDKINFNDFVGKDEDYIRDEIPGVSKPTAKKILEIVNIYCRQDVEMLKETLDILNIKDA